MDIVFLKQLLSAIDNRIRYFAVANRSYVTSLLELYKDKLKNKIPQKIADC